MEGLGLLAFERICNSLKVLIQTPRFRKVLSDVDFDLAHVLNLALLGAAIPTHEEQPDRNEQNHWTPADQDFRKRTQDQIPPVAQEFGSLCQSAPISLAPHGDRSPLFEQSPNV